MHPILTNGIRALLYFLAWIPIGAMLTYMALIAGGRSLAETFSIVLPLCVALAFVCLTPLYSCRRLPLRKSAGATLVLNHLAAAVVLSGVLGVLLRFATYALSPWINIPSGPPKELPMLAMAAFLLYLVSVAGHYAVLEVHNAREAEVLARDAELKALKAQINPHFLFNSLNSISALTTVDPKRAREMCLRLSEFLRTTLRFGDRLQIPLEEELALAKVYLEVEQVRFGSRLSIEQDIDPACRQCAVPPLIIQPLVENAVKHGVATMLEGGLIQLRCRHVDKRLEFSIVNSFDPESPSPRRNGVGLVNVRNRLQARYGDAARMQVRVEGTQYRVELSVPCEG